LIWKYRHGAIRAAPALHGQPRHYDPPFAEALATGHEVILTDNAAVGLSTGAAAGTVAGMARGGASLIDDLGLEQVDVFGFSMGGYVARQLAVDRPELVRRSILVVTSSTSPRKERQCQR
jgi:pimeloyl-ACP methyl ester carboxylesterase